MTINPIGPESATAATTNPSSAKLAENFDQFLSLLTTQLRNQNPLEPMDSQAFVDQLVKFSGVEQAINTNQKLDSLLSLQKGNQTLDAVGYIGRTVEAASDRVPLSGGAAAFSYTLPTPAASARVLIYDTQDQLVFATDAQTTAGRNDFAWDGTDNDGNALPDGLYRVVISAQDADTSVIEATTTVTARVTGVESGESGPILSLGPFGVPIASVIAVHENPA
jgi:flagellar basal-body rod modification protein FlgD